MGMLDNEAIFSDGQTVTATGDTPSTNVYDNAAGTNAIANNGQGDHGLTGEMLWINVRVKTSATSGGAATMQAVLQNSSDNATWVDVNSGPVVAVANLTAGADLLRVQPPLLGLPGMLRYWRIAYRVGTAALTAGTFDAYVSNSVQRNIPRASGFTV
jgi:hypothetical protein